VFLHYRIQEMFKERRSLVETPTPHPGVSNSYVLEDPAGVEKIYVHICVCIYIYIYLYNVFMYVPIPVAERSKAWVCSRSPARISGSNPAGGMDVCLL
jgi:hypothetical protein